MSRMNDLDSLAEDWSVAPLLAALAASDAVTPPAGLRERLLRRAGDSPPVLSSPATPIELYAGRVLALRELVDTLTDADWQKLAAPYDWTVHGLLAHLLVIERYTAAVFGIGAAPAGPIDDHLALGADVIADELSGTPVHTVREWAAAAQAVVEHIESTGFMPDAPAPLHGWPFSGQSALVARAFELWTHTEDIERAIGREARGVPAEVLRAMSSFSVSTLPFTLAMVAPDRAMAPTRIVLTGAGGGTFDIGGDGARAALLVTDVVDYCRLVARRLTVDVLDATVEGDAGLVIGLLRGAQVFAV